MRGEKRAAPTHLQTAAYPPFFYLPRSHHNNARVLLPHHLPEVIDRGIQATLAGNVGLGALIWADQVVLSVHRGRSGGLRTRQAFPHFGHTAIFQESHLDVVGIDIVRSRYIWVPSLQDDSGVINWGCSERINRAMRYFVPSHMKLLHCPMSPHSCYPSRSIFSPLLWGQTHLTPSSHLSNPMMSHQKLMSLMQPSLLPSRTLKSCDLSHQLLNLQCCTPCNLLWRIERAEGGPGMTQTALHCLSVSICWLLVFFL